MPDPNIHQLYQAFPKLDSLIVDQDGHWTPPWYRFMITLWQKLGGSRSNIQQSTFIVNDPNGNLTAHQSLSGEMIGPVPVGNDILVSLVIGPPQDPIQPIFIPPPTADTFLPLELIPPQDPFPSISMDTLLPLALMPPQDASQVTNGDLLLILAISPPHG